MFSGRVCRTLSPIRSLCQNDTICSAGSQKVYRMCVRFSVSSFMCLSMFICELFTRVGIFLCVLLWVVVCVCPESAVPVITHRSRGRGAVQGLTGGASFPECFQGAHTAITPLNRPIKMIHITFSHNCT